jgi:hypothetical protein
VVSHPGITFGGMLHQGKLRGAAMIDAFSAVVAHYREHGFSSLLYKAIPAIYHQSPAEDDLYALFRLGAQRTRCDLSCTIDLANRLRVSEQRRRSLRNAEVCEVQIIEGRSLSSRFWKILTANIERKYGVAPVHNLEEIQLLASKFPDNIHFVFGMVDNEVEAGVVLFVSPSVHHVQYVGATEIGYGANALDAIINHCIRKALEKNVRYFDFGISTEEQGRMLNPGLYQFKAGFGGAGIIYEQFEIALE